MSQNLNSAVAVIGIDIGKNSFHIAPDGKLPSDRFFVPLSPPDQEAQDQKSALTENAPYKACSAFTRVTACTLALSPYIVTRYPKASATSLPP